MEETDESLTSSNAVYEVSSGKRRGPGRVLTGQCQEGSMEEAISALGLTR